MIELSEQQIIGQLVHRLAGVYPDVESDQVARVVNEEYSRFHGRPIRDYIPLFVERHSADRLLAPFTSSNADVSVYTLMKLLGHESMVTSQCYDAAVRVLASEPTRSGSFADT